MGLGKTVQAATALKELFEQRAIRRVLIISQLHYALTGSTKLPAGVVAVRLSIRVRIDMGC